MASLNAVILPAKVLKGGRHKIRISVAHNGETRYLLTDIVIDSAKEFKNGMIVKRNDASILNTKIRGILQKYQSIIDDLTFVSGLDCSELIFQIKNAGNKKNRTLASIYDEYVSLKRVKHNTELTYKIQWNALCSYLDKYILVEHITHATVLGFDKYLHERGLKPSTIIVYMQFFAALVNYARRCGYMTTLQNPFNGYRLPYASPRQSWLSVEEVKRIRDIQLPRKNLRKCRDLFMLSYYLGGINMCDLLKINFNKNIDTISYVRTKTENRPKFNERVEFSIPSEAIEIIERMKGPDGRINVSEAQRKDTCNLFLRNNVHKLAQLTKTPQLVYYSARKSFAQHAFQLGIHPSIVNFILGHKVDKGGDSLFNYIFVTPEMATEAVRKVLDNLK